MPNANLNDEELWSAVQSRDASRDGEFFYGVLTTGVYCRPSCNSRRPLRKNVRFFTTTEAAERTGLRPCKRCRPTGATANVLNQVVHELARQIEAAPDSKLSLEQLAKRSGYSPFHLQRSFKAIMGSSPKEYQTAARVRMLKKELRNEAPVADAIYQAGFGSGSRVYEKADGQLGMTPSEYRSGGKGLTISYASGPTPLGLMMIGATDRGICFLQFGDDDQALLDDLRLQFPAAARASDARQLEDRVRVMDGRAQSTSTRPRAEARPATGRARHSVPIDRLALLAEGAVWRSAIVFGSRRGHRQTQCGASSRQGMCHQLGGALDPVSSRRARHRRARRLSLGHAAQAGAARYGTGGE